MPLPAEGIRVFRAKPRSKAPALLWGLGAGSALAAIALLWLCWGSRTGSDSSLNGRPPPGCATSPGSSREGRGEEVRVGDPDSVYDASKDDENFPRMKEWAKAGVRGGIPLRHATAIRARLKPGDDIQAAVNSTSEAGGVVLLAAGTYNVTETIKLPSNVILRGENREKTVLRNARPDAEENGSSCIFINCAKWVGVEDLTILNPPTPKVIPKGFKGIHTGLSILTVEDCWVDGCRLLNCSHMPITTKNSQHVTLRGNVCSSSTLERLTLSREYEVLDSKYVLMCNETICHSECLILAGNQHCVILNCFLGKGVALEAQAQKLDEVLFEGTEFNPAPKKKIRRPSGRFGTLYPVTGISLPAAELERVFNGAYGERAPGEF